MPIPIVRAGGKADLIIWIVLAVFWVIAQLATRARKRPPPRIPQVPRTPATPARSVEDDLAAFFESLATAQKPPDDSLSRPMRPVPYEQPKPAPPPQLTPQGRRLIEKRPRATRKRVSTAAMTPSPPPAPPPVFIPEIPQVTLEAIPLPEAADPLNLRSRSVMPKTPLLSSKAFKMPMMKLGGSTRRGRVAPAVGEALAGRTAVRTAIITRAILGPPKAFE